MAKVEMGELTCDHCSDCAHWKKEDEIQIKQGGYCYRLPEAVKRRASDLACIYKQPPAFDMFELIYKQKAGHDDLGICEPTGKFYGEVFTVDGKAYTIFSSKDLLDCCSDPHYTRGKLLEVWVNGLTGLKGS